ncbi:hypothetical protein DFQ26_005178 [Actinomortierella ambigua]|nr:hypothetical protein DFQ26_005178 [Actinomortierella ambigua]
MDHSNHGASTSTPWNVNLSYAVDWSIVLAVPVALLAVRHAVVLTTKALQRRKGRSSAGAFVGRPRHSEDSEDDFSDDDEMHKPSQHVSAHSTNLGGQTPKVEGPHPSKRPPSWSYGHVENWAVNKFSATLFFGNYLHLVAGVTLLTLIFLSILAVLLLSQADLYLNSNRAGYLGLSCIPFLFAFTGKNSIVSFLTGISHHRLNQVHRFLGLSLFTLVSVHMGCMFHVWWPWKKLLADQLASEKVRYGLATYTALGLMVVLAAWPVRRWAYEVFLMSHTLFLVFLVCVSLHTPYAMRFIVAGIVVYLLNVLAGWCVKTHSGLARATVYQGRLTRVTIAKPIQSRPGQHVYLCVPTMSYIQWHPFTISSSDEESITIHARAVGGYTRKLAQWPESLQQRVILTGPYGEGIQVGCRPSVDKVVFVAAGSGLSYVLPILTDLLERRQQGRRRKETGTATTWTGPIEVIWCIRDQDEVEWFREELEECLDRASGCLREPWRGGVDDKEATELLPSSPSKDDLQRHGSNKHHNGLRLVLHFTSLVSSIDVTTTADGGPVPVNRENSLQLQSIVSTTTGSVARSGQPFAGDGRVEWIQARLNVSDYVQRVIRETPPEREIDIVGCGPPVFLGELHNGTAKAESLKGCRVNLHTERFHL